MRCLTAPRPGAIRAGIRDTLALVLVARPSGQRHREPVRAARRLPEAGWSRRRSATRMDRVVALDIDANAYPQSAPADLLCRRPPCAKGRTAPPCLQPFPDFAAPRGP